MNFTINKRLRHIGWNLISGVIGGALTVLATGVMVRSLGYERFGIVSVWIMLQTVIQVFDFGIGSALNRELTKYNRNNDSLIGAVSQFYFLNGAFWALVGALILIHLYGWDSSAPLLFMLVALAIQFQTLRCSSILMANARYDDLAKAQIVSNFLRFGGAIAVVLLTNSLLYFFIYQGLAAWLGFSVFNKFVLKNNGPIVRPRIVECLQSITMLSRQSLGMWLTSLVSIGITSADRTLIGFMDGSLMIGKYSAALAAAGLVSLVTLPFYRVYFTEYSSIYFNDRSKLLAIFTSSCQRLAIFVTLLGVAAYFFADSFFYIWLGAIDTEQILTFRLLLIGMVFSSLTWLPGALCQAGGKPAVHVWVMAITFIISIIVAIPCIDKWGYPGASAIWLIHGSLGVIVEPYLINRYVFPINPTAWFRQVYTVPGLVVGILLLWNFFNV